MGFFALKAECSLCNKKIGLNRFKIKKSDEWICPECLKKAGGPLTVNLSEFTVEDIRKFIKEDGRDCDESEVFDLSNLKNADLMYRYCVVNNYTSAIDKNTCMKYFEVIEQNLLKNEEVYLAFLGYYNFESKKEKGDKFAYAVSNKRILIGREEISSHKEFEYIDINKISKITLDAAGLLYSRLTLHAFPEDIKIGLDNSCARAIKSKLCDILDKNKYESNSYESFEKSSINGDNFGKRDEISGMAQSILKSIFNEDILKNADVKVNTKTSTSYNNFNQDADFDEIFNDDFFKDDDSSNEGSGYNSQNMSVSPADEIKKYKMLLDMGAITEEEFERKKKQLLDL